uniref:Uncharacterized protein n=1 Tax=Anopheles minimus TaxID=112268 RepID=A0A182WMP6_9DIPT
MHETLCQTFVTITCTGFIGFSSSGSHSKSHKPMWHNQVENGAHFLIVGILRLTGRK